MWKFKTRNKKLEVILALVSGVVCGGLYKLYLYANDRQQFEDSNLLVSVAFVFVVASIIFLFLETASSRSSSK